jgi:hypothetical protein
MLDGKLFDMYVTLKKNYFAKPGQATITIFSYPNLGTEIVINNKYSILSILEIAFFFDKITIKAAY